ncbi:MAG: HNH endonuclease, partial [Hormoscilla sp. GM102CHS1]|nr:HNH endonuclease [Hormoscilla sp. GM102CHS1]
TVVSTETYADMDRYLWGLIWQWATRRHPNKSHQWIAKKYWRTEGLNNWVFKRKVKNGEEIGMTRHSETEIVRHVKVKGTSSPYNGDTVYWSQRLRKSPDVSRRVLKLLDRQEGKCALCGMAFRSGNQMEVDHVLPKSLGGKDWYINLQLLHDYCHDTKSAVDGSNGGRARLNLDGEIEDPDEVKVSRPVLKTSRGVTLWLSLIMTASLPKVPNFRKYPNWLPIPQDPAEALRTSASPPDADNLSSNSSVIVRG